MRSLRVILALTLLAAGAHPRASQTAKGRWLHLGNHAAADALAELAALTGDAGQFEVDRSATPPRIRLLNAGAPSAELVDWAARHGIKLPAEDDAPRFTAGEAVVVIDSGHRVAETESTVAILSTGDGYQPRRSVWAVDDAPRPRRCPPLGDRFACRAPPTA
jgi:hypothetical protein